MPIPTPQERIGMQLAGKYRLDRILGEGGFGIVYAGVHEWTGRPIAAKVLDYSLTTKEEFVTRFLREARVAAKLEHPHVVDVLDMGRDDDGTVYLVLEFLRGQDLSELLDAVDKLELRRAATYLLPIMDALVDAHQLGVVHRDLKPANIFLSKNKLGRVIPKLLDFGIAKDVHDGLVKTQTGAIYGTPDYMSPEQAAGASEVGPRTDVWAMGAVLFRVLTGELPYPTSDKKPILLQLISEPPRSLGDVEPSIPTAIVEVVDKALSHDETGRYDDMSGLFAAFVKALREAGEFPERLEPLLRRREVHPPDSGFPDSMTVPQRDVDAVSSESISGVVVTGTDRAAVSERELAHADTTIQRTPSAPMTAPTPIPAPSDTSAKSEPGISEPAKSEPAKSEPAIREPAKSEPVPARATPAPISAKRSKPFPWVIPAALAAMIGGAVVVISLIDDPPDETTEEAQATLNSPTTTMTPTTPTMTPTMTTTMAATTTPLARMDGIAQMDTVPMDTHMDTPMEAVAQMEPSTAMDEELQAEDEVEPDPPRMHERTMRRGMRRTPREPTMTMTTTPMSDTVISPI